MTKSLSLYFTAPRQVAVQEEHLPVLEPEQLLVQTELSGISPGTELLAYRGELPKDILLDDSISSLKGEFSYPFKYGYSTVGRVVALGANTDPAWKGRLVFSFQPHTSHFIALSDELILLPDDLGPEAAVFLPNMETAVNFLMDGAPLIGEHVVVFGQGIVGLLTTSLLARYPLGSLVTLDRYPQRRRASLDCGATASFDPAAGDLHKALGVLQPDGADLAFELSGSPAALNQALAFTGYSGRVVIGSWYGQKNATLDLGGRFHRSRIRLISSQVSSIAPAHSGRWDKARRFSVAWEMLRQVKPARWITHRFPLEQAGHAYRLLDEKPDQAIQVVFTDNDLDTK